MDLNKFTQKAQQAVLNAQQLAREFNHQSIEPSHLLLALLNQSESTVPAVITQIAGSAEILKEEVRKELASQNTNGGNVAAATLVGKRVAEKAKAAGIELVAFDRSGFRYHGRVKALADAAREAGLKF